MDTKIFEDSKKLISAEIYHCINITIKQELKKFREENESDDIVEFEEYFLKTGEYPEIFEYWAISEWLGNTLKKQGEVIFQCLDFTVWGRQTTGQAIALDGVIQEIVKKRIF